MLPNGRNCAQKCSIFQKFRSPTARIFYIFGLDQSVNCLSNQIFNFCDLYVHNLFHFVYLYANLIEHSHPELQVEGTLFSRVGLEKFGVMSGRSMYIPVQ